MALQPDLDEVFRRIETLAAERGLPAERSTNYGTPSLKTGKRTFARLKDATTLVLMCPGDQKALLMEMSPDIYFETEHYVGYDAVLVQLSVISDEELSLRLQDACTFKETDKPSAGMPAP